MANRYWVGGTGNWSSTTKWSTTSGGASGASVPTSVDDVIFDANSGGKFTATVDTAQSVNSITITPSAAVGVQQIALSARLTTNNLTTTGTAGNNRIWFRGNTYGIAQDFVVNGTVSISDCDFRDIYVIGTAAPISGTRIGDLRGIRGITASTPKTVYWNLAAGGNWSANAWAATSGGAVSTDNFPLAQDTAVIENTGLNTSATVTLDAAITNIGTVDMSGRTTAMTIANSSAPSIYGNLKAGSNVTFSTSNALNFSGRNTQTITSSGRTIGWDITVTSFGGTVQLADALNMSTNTLIVLHGTFNTQNYNVTAGSLSSSNSNVRTITLGSSTVTLSQSSGVNFGNNTNLTFNSGTSQLTTLSNNPTIDGGTATVGVVFYNVTMNGATSGNTQVISGANTFNNLTITAPAGVGVLGITFDANQTITGTLTCSGATAVRRIFLRSDTLGTTRTLTVNSLSAQDCDFRDITIAGAAAGSSPTRAGDCGGNTGITFPAVKTVYWNLAGTQNWSSTAWAPGSGGTPAVNNFPLAQDTAVFDNTGSVGTVTINAAWNIGAFNASARTSAMTLNPSASPTFYGNFLYGTGTTVSSSANTFTFSGRGTQTITSNGVTTTNNVTIDCATGTVQLADALTLNSALTLTLTSGTFDAVTYNVTAGAVANSQSFVTLKMGTGTWTLSGTATVWSLVTGVTFLKGTANIVLSNTSTTARTFNANTYSFNKLTIGGATGVSTTTISNGGQFTELASTKTVAHTIDLGTAALTLGAWTVTGTVGNVVTVTGTAVLTITGAAVSGVDYLALGTTTVSATSPGEFYAGANSTGTAAAPVYRTAKPADSTRYWVGGSGNWSSTTKWSTSSGGASGASVPRSHDDVVFNSASNATAYTATVDAVTGGIRCKALTIAGPASGNVTLAGSTAIVGIHGNVTLPATGLIRTYTGAITLSGSGSATITTNGISLGQDMQLNGIGSNWSLGSALTLSTSSNFTLINGTFNTANYNCSFARFFVQLSGSSFGSTTLNLGSSTITENTIGFTINGSNPNFTLNAGTSTFNNTWTSDVVIQNSSPNTLTFYNYNFTGTNPTSITITGTNIFNNLSFAGRTVAGITPINIGANQTINGTLTLSAGTNATMRTFVRSDTIGTTRTLTCAAFSGTDADFRDIAIAGAAAPVSGTRLGDCKGNSGITFPAAKTVYWAATTGGTWGQSPTSNWALTNGGARDQAAFPLAQDTATFGATLSSGQTVTVNTDYNIGTIDMSARTSNTMTLATGSTTPTIYGNWINGTGTTLTGTGVLTFAGRGSQTITSAGQTFTQKFIFNSPGGTLTLQDAFTANQSSTSVFVISAGTFNAATYNVTFSGALSAVSSSSVITSRTIAIGSGTWTIAGSNFVWDMRNFTGLTITGTGTISLTSASAKTFAGGSVSYSGITLDQGGAGTLTITGNNTFADISNTYKATGATTINMGTTTQTVGNFTASGEAGRVLTVQGSSAASPATLVFTGSGQATTPTTDYLTITGVRAYSLDTTWYAGANSTNNGSLGWYFEAGASGPIAVFIIESSTAADAQSSTATLYSAASETTTASDAAAAGLIYIGTLGESVTASDAAAAGLIYIGTLSESATASDVVEAFKAYFAAIAEAATSADLVSASGALAAAISELTVASDTAFNSLLAQVALAESVRAFDVSTVTAAFIAQTAEITVITDQSSVPSAILNAAAIAAAQAAESFSSVGVYNAVLPIQGAGASDSLRRLKLRSVFIDDFVYTGADTTALTVDATVSGNTASGTVESGQITATVLP